MVWHFIARILVLCFLWCVHVSYWSAVDSVVCVPLFFVCTKRCCACLCGAWAWSLSWVVLYFVLWPSLGVFEYIYFLVWGVTSGVQTFISLLWKFCANTYQFLLVRLPSGWIGQREIDHNSIILRAKHNREDPLLKITRQNAVISAISLMPYA